MSPAASSRSTTSTISAWALSEPTKTMRSAAASIATVIGSATSTSNAGNPAGPSSTRTARDWYARYRSRPISRAGRWTGSIAVAVRGGEPGDSPEARSMARASLGMRLKSARTIRDASRRDAEVNRSAAFSGCSAAAVPYLNRGNVGWKLSSSSTMRNSPRTNPRTPNSLSPSLTMRSASSGETSRMLVNEQRSCGSFGATSVSSAVSAISSRTVFQLAEGNSKRIVRGCCSVPSMVVSCVSASVWGDVARPASEPVTTAAAIQKYAVNMDRPFGLHRHRSERAAISTKSASSIRSALAGRQREPIPAGCGLT